MKLNVPHDDGSNPHTHVPTYYYVCFNEGGETCKCPAVSVAHSNICVPELNNMAVYNYN